MTPDDAPRPAPRRLRVYAFDNLPRDARRPARAEQRSEGYWYEHATEPDLREGLRLSIRLHCWMVRDPRGCGPECDERFAEFDAALASGGLEAARRYAKLLYEALWRQRVAQGLHAFPETNAEGIKFWRHIHNNKRCKKVSVWEHAIVTGSSYAAGLSRSIVKRYGRPVQ